MIALREYTHHSAALHFYKFEKVDMVIITPSTPRH
jgi:hypothetical protein